MRTPLEADIPPTIDVLPSECYDPNDPSVTSLPSVQIHLHWADGETTGFGLTLADVEPFIAELRTVAQESLAAMYAPPSSRVEQA